jgi:signal transduction histidine kinase/ligand-binding sensor domain-containing protein
MQRITLFLANMFFCVTCFAQQYPFVHYTPKDGLVNSRSRSAFQDSKGRMYFLTYGGLSVYDGTKFTNYTAEDGLANDVVNDILEAGPDSFLVATNANKLNTLAHGKTGLFTTANNFCPVINRFFSAADGHLYVAADEGLFRLEQNRFIHLPLCDKYGNDIGRRLSIIIEWNNLLLITPWEVGEKEKLIVYDKQTGKVKDVLTSLQIINIAKSPDGSIWAGTEKGPLIIDTEGLQNDKIIMHSPPEKFSAIAGRTGSIYFDKAGNTWLQDISTIIKFDKNGDAQLISEKQGLKPDNINGLFRDREGIIWFTTEGSGIIKMTNTNIELLTGWGNNPSSPVSAISTNNLSDTAWLYNVTANKVYRAGSHSKKEFTIGKKIAANNILSAKQALYLIDDKAIYKIENKNYPADYQHPAIIYTDTIPSIIKACIDPFGNIILYHQKQGSSYIMVLKQDRPVFHFRVKYIIDQFGFDKHNRLWAATRTNELLVFKIHAEKPENYLELLHNYEKEIPLMSPRSLTIDTNENIWIGTRYNGICRLEMDDLHLKSWKQFSVKQGMTDNFIYRLACDKNNNIWAGTQTGLDKISLKNKQYVIENVTRSNDFFQTIVDVAADGENNTWALCSNGTIIKVNQPESVNPVTAPALLLTELKVNGKVNTNRMNTSFAYHQNDFTFSVAAPSFIDEKQIQYSYLLEDGGNDDWSDPSNNATFNFIHLAPGKYILRVKAGFPAVLYPSQSIAFSFVISPPWWQTRWFYFLVGLLVIGLLVLINRSYLKRKLQKQKIVFEKQHAIEQERTRIAMEMHDDLGSGLTGIRYLTGNLTMDDPKSIQEKMSMIAAFAKSLVDNMNDIIWTMKSENNTLEELLVYIRKQTAEQLESAGILYGFDFPKNIPAVKLSSEQKRNLLLITKEAVHNAIKHAHAGKVTISVMINKEIILKVNDDGKGIDLNDISRFSNGLKNMQRRTKEIGGRMLIENEKGTTVTVIMPLQP